MKIFKKLSLSFYCITLAIFCQAFLPNLSASAANVNDFEFESFVADYYLSRDEKGISHLRVVERLTAFFPNRNQNHGITRVIPFTNQAGKNLTVADPEHFALQAWQNNAPIIPYEIETKDGYFKVMLGDPDTYIYGRQIYTLEYEFENVITDFSNFQELYWDTNGVDWPQKFESLIARVHFEDADVSDAFTGQAWCYVGIQGSRDTSRCEILQNDDGLEFRAQNLQGRENLTFDLEFKPDTFVVAKSPKNYTLLIAFIGEIILAGGIIAFTIYVYNRTKAKRQFYKDLFVAPQYAPPAGLTVAEAADCNMQDLISNSKVATLLELAVNGHIELIQNEDKKAKKPVWTVRIKDTKISDAGKVVLQILRGKSTPLEAGEEFMLKNHTNNSTLTKLIAKFPKDVKKQAYAKGLMETDTGVAKPAYTPDEKLCNHLAVVSAVWAFVGAIGIPVLESSLPSYGIVFGHTNGDFGILDASIIIVFIATFLIPLIVSILCSRYAARTEKGLSTARYLEGLKLYIKMAEKERIAFLQSVKGVDTSHQGIAKLYEKLLPYAVLFRLEKSWLKEMGRYYEYDDVSAPTWYMGYTIFSAQAFSDALNSATSSANSSFISASPSSSSSSVSGGGGGGFSGGGGGGGGGGGW